MLVLALVSCLVASSIPAVSAAAKPQVIVLIRYDDYSAVTDTKLEQRLLHDFRVRGAPLTVGVIPRVASVDCHDPRPQRLLDLPREKAVMLASAVKAGTAEVALHGYSHQTTRERNPSHGYTEFEGVPYRRQLQRIRDGKRLLEELMGMHISVFIPPWNSYDLSTVRALEALGFSALSANVKGPVQGLSRLSYVPVTSDLADAMEALAEARRDAPHAPIVGLLFHDFDIRESVRAREGAIPYSQLLATLDWLKQQPDVRLCTVSEAARATPLGASRLVVYQGIQRSWLLQLSPDFIRKRYLSRYSYPNSEAIQKTGWVLALSAFYATALAFGAAVSAVMLLLGRWVGTHIASACLLVAFVAIAAFSARRWDWPLAHAVVLAYAIGSAAVALAVVVAARRRRKRA